MNFILRNFRKIAVACFVFDAACVIGLIAAAIHFIAKAW